MANNNKPTNTNNPAGTTTPATPAAPAEPTRGQKFLSGAWTVTKATGRGLVGAVAQPVKDELATLTGSAGKGFTAAFSKSMANSAAKKKKEEELRLGTNQGALGEAFVEHTRMVASALTSIDKRIQNIQISQRNIQNTLNRIVFMIEEMKGVRSGANDNYRSPLSQNQEPKEKSLIEKLMDAASGLGNLRGGPKPTTTTGQTPGPKPSVGSRIGGFARGALRAAPLIGTVIGAGSEAVDEYSETGSAGRAAGVGGGALAGGLAGGAAGAKGGAAIGAAIGALFGGVGAVPGAAIGGFLGGTGGAIGGTILGAFGARKLMGAPATRQSASSPEGNITPEPSTPVRPTGPTPAAGTVSTPLSSQEEDRETRAGGRNVEINGRELNVDARGDARFNSGGTMTFESRSSHTIIFKSPHIKFETDKLEFVYKEKIERQDASSVTNPNTQTPQSPGGGNPGGGTGGNPGGGTNPDGSPSGSTGPGSQGSQNGSSPGPSGSTSSPRDTTPIKSVVQVGPGWNIVELTDGSQVKRIGARNWRNNNPGNMEYGPRAIRYGAIGRDPRFAIFPTYSMGRRAKEALLFESDRYRGKSIIGAIAIYAPASDRNDVQGYTASVCRATGASPNTLLSSLTTEQRQKMLDAMERVEGFREGRVEVIRRGNGAAAATPTPPSGGVSPASPPTGSATGSSSSAAGAEGPVQQNTSSTSSPSPAGASAAGPSGAAASPSAATGNAERREGNEGSAASGTNQQNAGASTGSGGNIREAQGRATRRLPISPQLRSVLQTAGRAAGVDITVTSGGQPPYPRGPRVGSTRHDNGNAADLDLYMNGRILSDRNRADVEIKKKFVTAAASAGATGIGAGMGYMGPTKIHVGFGTRAKWGGAPWLSGVTPGSGTGATSSDASGGSGGSGGSGEGAEGAASHSHGAAGGTGGSGSAGGMGGMGGIGGMGGMGNPFGMIGGLMGGLIGGRRMGGIGSLLGGMAGNLVGGLMNNVSNNFMPSQEPRTPRGAATADLRGDSAAPPPMPPRRPNDMEMLNPPLPPRRSEFNNNTPERSDSNPQFTFFAEPPADFFSATGFSSVTPDPNFYGPGGKSNFSSGRLA